MRRRKFGLLAGSSLAAVKLGSLPAGAQTSADPSLLTTTLTPMGSERAGNADGSIPAWTGGYTTLAAGWQPGQSMPDFFANEQPIAVIDAGNMEQYKDKLSEGVMTMMTNYGFSIKIYPTHRTHAVPQSVADNIAKNVTRAHVVDPANPQNGFTGGFGGYPFPIPDTSNPLIAGAQIIYNNNNRWGGFASILKGWGYAINSGQLVLTLEGPLNYDYPYYYRPDLAYLQSREYLNLTGPANIVGEQVIIWSHNDTDPQDSWELLEGQGRVRKAPELTFDSPSSFADGIANVDEYYGFNGQLIRYDWKYLGKKEMYIPYNNNAMYLLSAEDVLKEKFVNPDVIRWELHRVWVVEATLHPGERNVLARRMLYVNEDNWLIGVADAWDANGNLYRSNHCYNFLRPDLPGLIFGNNAIYNLQTGNYALPLGFYNEGTHPTLRFTDSWPDSTFDPTNMATAAQY